MIEARKSSLPPGALGTDRHFSVGYTSQGDLLTAFWNGKLDFPEDEIPANMRVFPFAHGSDVTLIASFVGFYRRLGVDESTIAQVFRHSARNILVQADLADTDFEYRLSHLSHLDHILSGNPLTRFDMPFWNLDCLYPPIPSQPGIVERVGGVGIYTREDILGNFVLTLLHHPSRVDSYLSSRRIFAELSHEDIPVVAENICDNSLGEYRRDIYALINSLFSDET